MTLHGYPMSDAEGRLVMACATSAPETLDHSPNMISKVVVKHTQSCDWVWEGSDVPALLPWSVVQESTQYAVVYEMTYLLEIASEMVAQQPVAGSCYLSETGAVVCDGVDSSSDTMVMRVIAAGTVLLTATAIFAVIHLKGVVASRGGSKSLTRPSAFHAPVAVRVADRNSSTANDHSVSLASNSMTAPPPMPTFQPVWSQLCVDRIAVVCEEDSNNFAWSSVPGGVVTSRRVVTKAQQKRYALCDSPFCERYMTSNDSLGAEWSMTATRPQSPSANY